MAGGNANVELTEDTITGVVQWAIPDADRREIDASLDYWGAGGQGLKGVRSLSAGKTSIDPYDPALEGLRRSSNAISRRFADTYKNISTKAPTEEEITDIVQTALTVETISAVELNASLFYWGGGGAGLLVARLMASGRHTIDTMHVQLNTRKSNISQSLARCCPEVDTETPTETQITEAVRSVISDPSPDELQASLMYWGPAGSGLRYARQIFRGQTCIDPKFSRVIGAKEAISRALVDLAPELAAPVRRGPQTSRLPSDEQVEAAVRRALPDATSDEMSACQRYWGPGGTGLGATRRSARRSTASVAGPC
jgi:hypothetical protein